MSYIYGNNKFKILFINKFSDMTLSTLFLSLKFINKNKP